MKPTPGMFYPSFVDVSWSIMSSATGMEIAVVSPIGPEEANAQLLAGAPEMAEMLMRCEMWLSTFPEGHKMRDSVRGTLIKVGVGP